ncbi:MAG: hypothetical protein FWD58_05335 [Firmicutes bacterium]|nr:hypothetical protein [Bacillota bacterium]
MKQKISDSVDRVLLFLVSGFFAVAIVGYFSRNTAVILSAGFAGAVSVTALTGLLKSRRKSRSLTAGEFSDVMMQFYLMGAAGCFEAVLRALERNRPKKRDGYILAGKTAVFVEFYPEPLSLARLFQIYAEVNAEANAEKPKNPTNGDGGGLPPPYEMYKVRRVLVLTMAGATDEVLKTAPLLPGAPVTVFGGERTCRLLRFLGGLPEVTLALKREKRSYRRFLSAALSGAACKRYLITALLLVGTSFIMPMPLYYLIAAAFLITLAVLAKMNVGKRLNPNL